MTQENGSLLKDGRKNVVIVGAGAAGMVSTSVARSHKHNTHCDYSHALQP